MYHYIFFDLDGTLTDSKEGILNSLRYAFDKLGEPVPPESTLIKFIGPPLQDSFAEFCGFSAERAAEAIAVFRERYEPVGKFENMAAPGMADLCARLKARGYVLALASSKPESLCVPICEKFGFTPSLAVVTGSPPVGDWSKADVIRETMRRLELTDIALAAVVDAMASAVMEELCNALEAEIRTSVQAQGHYLTGRFSPGYGDCPLTLQQPFAIALDTVRGLGMAVTPENLLTPRKSVTAILGVADHPVTGARAGCGHCLLREKCEYRKRGTTCEN